MEGVFASNPDRFTAKELAKRQNHEALTRRGFLLQAVAASGHRKTPEEVAELAEKVGRGRILVCCGGGDQMVAVGLAEALVQQMNAGVAEGGGGVKFVILRAQVMCWRWSSTDKW